MSQALILSKYSVTAASSVSVFSRSPESSEMVLSRPLYSSRAGVSVVLLLDSKVKKAKLVVDAESVCPS